MKRLSLLITTILISISCFAQQQLAFPYKGGKDKMVKFFKDSLVVSQDIINRRITGVVIFKFTADDKGSVSKTIVFYADDANLTIPVIAAIKKTSGNWTLTAGEKSHDFLLPVYIRYNLPENDDPSLQKSALSNYRNKHPIFTNNQVPLDMATLLPAITISYNVLL
ncbi:MAG: hypothetical protein V4577_23010 [Bacteroidota bacterium]